MALWIQNFRLSCFVSICLILQYGLLSNCEESSYVAAASYAQPILPGDFGPEATVSVSEAGVPVETSVISYGSPQPPGIYGQPLPSPYLTPYPLGFGGSGGGGWGWNGPQLLPFLLQQQQQFPPQFLGNFYGTPGWGWPRPLAPFLR